MNSNASSYAPSSRPTGRLRSPRSLHGLAAALFVGAAALSLHSTVAHAGQDAKYYLGSECQPMTPRYAAQTYYGATGAITNDSTSTIYITCPIIRDKITEHWDSVSITANDRHSSLNIACTFMVFNRGGTVLESRTLRTFGMGVQVRGVSRPRSGTTPGFASAETPPAPDQAYALRCALPGKATLRSITGSSLLRYEVFER